MGQWAKILGHSGLWKGRAGPWGPGCPWATCDWAPWEGQCSLAGTIHASVCSPARAERGKPRAPGKRPQVGLVFSLRCLKQICSEQGAGEAVSSNSCFQQSCTTWGVRHRPCHQGTLPWACLDGGYPLPWLNLALLPLPDFDSQRFHKPTNTNWILWPYCPPPQALIVQGRI